MDEKHQTRRDIPPKLRRRIYCIHGSIWFVWPAALTWGIYLALVWFRFDLSDFMHGRGQGQGPDELDRTTMYLIFAIIATVGGLALAVVRIRRALRLAEYGIEIIATVSSVGRLAMHGLVRVDFEYSYGSGTFQKAMSVAKAEAIEYQNGTKQLVILVDPKCPSRWMQKSLVLPAAKEGRKSV